MNSQYIIRGMFGAGAGFFLAQIGGIIGHGLEPLWLVPILFLCLAWWIGWTVAAVFTKDTKW